MSPAKLRAQITRFMQTMFSFANRPGAAPEPELNRLKWLHERGNCLSEQLCVEPIPAQSDDYKVVEQQIARWGASIERQIAQQTKKALQSKEQNFAPTEHHSSKHDVHQPDLSDSAKHELLRIDLAKRSQVVRSLGGARLDELDDEETLFVDEWNCSGSSLLAIVNTQEMSPVERVVAQLCSEEPLTVKLPAMNEPELQKLVEEAPKAKPKSNFNVPGNPYRDYSETTLALLAQNPSTQRAALVWLSYHPNADVRGAVARNPNCSSETLSYLAKDSEAGIRHAIADNQKCGMAILEMLAVDKNPLIAWRAQNSLSIARGRRTVTDLRPSKAPKARPVQMTRTGQFVPFAEELANTDETINFLRLIARKSGTPIRRLAELASHPDTRVREAVAENANTPPELLWTLARDKSIEVKLKVTENYNCPIEILEALKDDCETYVCWQARSVLHRLNNPNQPNPFMESSSVISSTTNLRIVTSRELP
jgi:hypothetical protein